MNNPPGPLIRLWMRLVPKRVYDSDDERAARTRQQVVTLKAQRTRQQLDALLGSRSARVAMNYHQEDKAMPRRRVRKP